MSREDEGAVRQKAITDHHDIMAWAQRHDATPAQLIRRTSNSDVPTLHFIFGSKASEHDVIPISWENFFTLFNLMGLAMIFDETPSFQILHDISHPDSQVEA